jgi:protein-tyrosine phosphatase
LDDGPADLEGSLEIVDGLVDIGYDTICATPHQRVGLYLPDLEAVIAAAETLGDALERRAHETDGEAGSKAEIIAGVENCWDELLFQRSQEDRIPGYGATKVFLVEAPGPFVPPELDQQLFDWRRRGYLPVMAHVERYLATTRYMERMAELSQMAVLTCNLDAVAGAMGRRVAKAARALLQDGTVHALCTDIHVADSLKATAQGVRWVRRKLGLQAVVRLLDENPRRALAGELPD